MKSRKNTTFIKKILLRIEKSWDFFRFFRTKKLRDTIQGERKKKFLYQIEKGPSSNTWGKVIQKARRGAYFRPMYSVFRTHKAEYTIAFATIGVLLLILTGYIIIYSAYFRLTPSRVIIERLDEYSDINIAYKAIEPLYGESLWLLSRDRILQNIQALEKNVSNAQITHLYPNNFRIIIESYPPVFSAFVPGNQKSYLLTQNGVIIPDRSKKADLPRIRLYSEVLVESQFLDYKEAIPPEKMKTILAIVEVFRGDFPKYAPTGLTYFALENELHLILENGTRILLALDDSLEKQLLWLKFAIDRTPGLLSSGEYIYVDARVVTKIFSCKEKVLCTQNLTKIYGSLE